MYPERARALRSGNRKRNHRHGLSIIFLIFTISACIPAGETLQPTPFTPDRTIAPEIPSVDRESGVVPSAPEGDCGGQGSTERYSLESKMLNGMLYYTVYFPPCYARENPDGYPVLYLLHGQNFTDAMWLDLGAAAAADELITNGDAAPFLMVMPYEEYFFRGADDNKFPDALTAELIPEVEDSFNGCGERACRALGGISRGAAWAMRIGLQEWDLFASIGAHSLPTFRGDIDRLPEWLDAIPYGEEPRIWLDTGRFDPEVKAAYRFAHVFDAKGIPHEWHLKNGRHNEAYWSKNMESYLRWYAAGWE